MDLNWATVVPGAFAIGGVLVGGWVGSAAEGRRWRRDWQISRIAEIRTHFAEVVEAVDAQWIVTGQAVQALKGQRVPVPDERVAEVSQAWARAYSRSLIQSPENVQHAIRRYDEARNDVVLAQWALNVPDAEKGLVVMEAARGEVLAEMNAILEDINASLATLVLSRRDRFIRWIRRGDSAPEVTPR